MNDVSLIEVGWNAHWNELFTELSAKTKGCEPARIIRTEREHYLIQAESGIYWAKTAGIMRHHNEQLRDWPLIGDWVMAKMKKNSEHYTIQQVFPRTTIFSRRQAGERGRGEQPVAANVDYALLVASLEGGRHFNANRIERFLGMVVSQQITPMVVLNKIDLVDPDVLDDAIAIAGRIAGDQNVFTTSALESKGLDRIDAALPPYSTGIFIGLSGAGKTSLFNKLTLQDHAVNAVRTGDRRGRHTTTCRMMEPMAGRAQVIDTPGIREWQAADSDVIDDAFDDIHEWSASCRFRNCSHMNEPGCAVQQALAEGALELRRYENFIKMRTNKRCRPR